MSLPTCRSHRRNSGRCCVWFPPATMKSVAAAVGARIRHGWHHPRRRRPTSSPGCRWHRRQRADPGAGGLPHFRRLEAPALAPLGHGPGGKSNHTAVKTTSRWVRHQATVPNSSSPHELSVSSVVLNDDERVIVETAAAFVGKRLAPHARMGCRQTLFRWTCCGRGRTSAWPRSIAATTSAGLRWLDGVRPELSYRPPTR